MAVRSAKCRGTPKQAVAYSSLKVDENWVLAPVIGAFAEMPSDVDALTDVTASALAADHIQFFSTSAVEAKGMYKQRIRTAWGHAANWVGPPPA